MDASRAYYPRSCRPTIWALQGMSSSCTKQPPELTVVQVGEMDKPTNVGVGAHRRKHRTKPPRSYPIDHTLPTFVLIPGPGSEQRTLDSRRSLIQINHRHHPWHFRPC
ncbi:hypothetical protein JVT61DRAFT_13238 [Boletus reticuloceps]|uniref:Uncharacterized protein n=1 Tax=Boletus reticuloceps TaxID=495285 RepID=A0A8I2YYP9_9AGAM|nr:hypothetical protein JVT61DRAFT_13238 [Boletus reticuloceps]